MGFDVGAIGSGNCMQPDDDWIEWGPLYFNATGEGASAMDGALETLAAWQSRRIVGSRYRVKGKAGDINTMRWLF
ncbi:MAG: hypothetical protein R3E42_02140 [Burkholderiaceae bacterium]